MAELIFESTLTQEEIEQNFRDINLFDGIMSGLEEPSGTDFSQK